VLDVCSYRSIKSMLETGMDNQPLPESNEAEAASGSVHKNVRGGDYYRLTQREGSAFAQQG
jgi:hypothetical protein